MPQPYRCRKCREYIPEGSIDCPFCGQAVASPEGQQRNQSRQKAIPWIVCVGVLVLLSMGGLYFATIGDNPPTPLAFRESFNLSPPSGYVQLKAMVEVEDGQLILTNLDSFNWDNVKLDLNPGPLSTGYIHTITLIQSGKLLSVGLFQFQNKEGERFNPDGMKLRSLSISCETPNGKGFLIGKW